MVCGAGFSLLRGLGQAEACTTTGDAFMGFAAGSVSFARFAVVGEHPRQIEQSILDRFSELTLESGEYGVPEEVEYGWCGGRHILDRHFTFEHNVYADALHFAMRIDTNRVPSELKHAYQAIEDRKSTRLNSSHVAISYAVFCLKKKNKIIIHKR